MKKIKVGDRVVYEHPDGGFNALVTMRPKPDSTEISLVFVNPGSGEVEHLADVPHISVAKVEMDVPKLVGPKGKKKLTTVKEMRNKPNGFWRG